MRSSRTRIALTVATVLLVVACGAAAPERPSGAARGDAPGPTPTVLVDGLGVSNVWVRPALGPAEPAAGYLTITNTSTQEDTLIGASTPAAASVEIHQPVGDGTTTEEVGSVRIPAGISHVTFLPGGNSLVLRGVREALPMGGIVLLTLTFEHVGDITVRAVVRPA